MILPNMFWTAGGFFAFEDIPLETDDTRLIFRALRLEADPSICEVIIRRSFPRKTIHQTTFYATGDPTVDSDGGVWVSSVIGRTGASPVVENEGLRQLLGNVERPSPNLVRFDVDSDQWSPIALEPEHHFDNEAARFAIDEILINSPLDIDVDNNEPEATRYLRALDRFASRPDLDWQQPTDHMQ